MLISFRMEVYRGYTTAIAPFGTGQVLLQIDAAHRILRTDTAYKIIQDCWNSTETEENYKNKARKALLGCIVMTRLAYMAILFLPFSFLFKHAA